MFKTLAILATLALASAQDCPPPTSSSTPPPKATGTVIHPNGDTSKCLDVQGANFANGTPVQIWDCNGTPAQSWTLQRGAGKVKLAANGTNFCLDAGTNPANGVGMKIWSCVDVPQQNWFYTDDNRIALTGQGFCLDLTNGDKTDGNRVQIWQCGTGNNNQVWTTNVLRRRYMRS
ncbi:uncharacterized protein CcaverHIS019_0206630 [Cutaneotrichosporon cavernicola]|uniref:Ricin B lectin domain-containing protein n=1 Tax=Cutaneotrichosporon cavernicola TaxID=279322 RepID=A0AA48L020_9TREE|nr:uncharacterized protein CcaverHIS019_0206630 [Cutaneotrichosporon cavernicola]BEI89301.1 hypothetical protein CcaverHIS019_0206630 [Cutaneotrichosporon cavernicola]BEI97077.1 hypothetical protein CcaverHIS631_0206660 [Cutaneotrichosporon cavernicola]BEJ04850.1 hypothetical protein CcaverHIS641_0206670 [Cutaneotrichosporon cavernicola]